MAHEIKLRFSHKYNHVGYSELYFTTSLQNMKKTPVCNWLLGKNKKENLAGNRSCSKYISKFRIVTLTGCFYDTTS